jgi:hypothetical protein
MGLSTGGSGEVVGGLTVGEKISSFTTLSSAAVFTSGSEHPGGRSSVDGAHEEAEGEKQWEDGDAFVVVGAGDRCTMGRRR